MTIEEFNKTEFTCGSKAIYKGEELEVLLVDYTESLLGLDDPTDEDSIVWVRCENCELKPSNN